MPFQSTRAKLVLDEAARSRLTEMGRSRKEPAAQVQRARMLLAYADGRTISAIARDLRTDRPKVERCVDKALELGPLAALVDLPKRGRPPRMTSEARTWVLALACRKPKELGYSYELWTTALLAKHVRTHAMEAGHPCLQRLARGSVSKILQQSKVRPHKIRYYLERRDPEFDAKMAQVLCVYKQVQMIREGAEPAPLLAILSFDEKPGIQAIENTAADLPPVPGEQPCLARDHEYIRHGTVTLMAGIDLLDGRVHGQVVDRHRSREFIAFLRKLDGTYPPATKIRVVLDNHSAHISKETRAYLATAPNRFEFVFTPKHGSWLNLIESFFGKMAKSMLRGLRVASKAELKARIEQYLQEVNDDPVVFRWKYRMDAVSVT